ncbi:MAG TPA: right-handed parallel beta-helix repeat-containing protein [Flavipsychrobacter sp.]|nr:right-handed parallel beta-helix repeat-containing protein [Flavipsychrobacter sp.]
MKKVFCIAIIQLLLCNSVVFATNYYVSTNGNNKNSGLSLSQSWATLGCALVSSLAASRGYQPGDTLFVAPGTYSEYLDLGHLSNIVVIAYDMNNRPIIKPINSPTHVVRITNQSHNAAFIGFVIDGSSSPLPVICGIKVTGQNVHDIWIADCEIKNCMASGVMLSDLANHITFDHLVVHDNGDGKDVGKHGFYIVAPYVTVQYCTVYHHAGDGIKIGTDDCKNESNFDTIRDNICYSNSYHNTSPRSGILVSSTDTGTMVYNNISYDNNDGIIIELHANNVKVYNNTCYNNKANGIYVHLDPCSLNPKELLASEHVSIKNNLLYKNNSNRIFGVPLNGFSIDSLSAKTIDTGNNWLNNGDPKLVNPDAGDFHVAAHSPLIDAGEKLKGVNTDFDKKRRPKSRKYTIGAFEGPEE